MFPKKYFRFVMLVMCVVMSFVNACGLHFPGFFCDIAIGTVVAYAASMLLPVWQSRPWR